MGHLVAFQLNPNLRNLRGRWRRSGARWILFLAGSGLNCAAGWGWRSIVQQLNSWILKADTAGFVEGAERLFERLLAGAEYFPDRLRRAFVIELQAAALAFERLDDLVRERGDTLVPGGFEAQIDLAAGTDAA